MKRYIYNNNFGWIDQTIYPELKLFTENKQLIINELKPLIDLQIWSIFKNNYSVNDSLTSVTNNKLCLSYKLIGDKSFQVTPNRCPVTTKLIKSIDYIHTAEFFCLESNSNTHRLKYIPENDSDSIYRCHIPLIIPYGNCFLEVNGAKKIWSSQPSIFDPSLDHNFWNYSLESLFILVLDITKKEKKYSSRIRKLKK